MSERAEYEPRSISGLPRVRMRCLASEARTSVDALQMVYSGSACGGPGDAARSKAWGPCEDRDSVTIKDIGRRGGATVRNHGAHTHHWWQVTGGNGPLVMAFGRKL
jgi:hypothetical protein